MMASLSHDQLQLPACILLTSITFYSRQTCSTSTTSLRREIAWLCIKQQLTI